MRAFGRYRLVEPIASGGMADVWRAEVSLSDGVTKEVALKLIRGEHDERSEFVRMFVEEARLAARLSHANVVQVFEFDRAEGRPYLAMELVRGRDLGRVVERCRELGIRLGIARAVNVGAEVAKGLAYAHRLAGPDGRPLGLVHRDVSPHNVLLSFEGEVKLADFGIARAMNRAGLTAPGTLKGKLAYMAPEQAHGGVVDARADVFALGVVLWELCAGRRLFARDTDAATLAAVLADDAVSPPSAWNEDAPPDLDAAILRALERDVARRTPSAQDLAMELAAVLLKVARTPEELDVRALMHRLWPDAALPPPRAAEPTRVRPPTPSASAIEAPAVDPDATTRTAPQPRRRRRMGRVGVLAVAALAAAGVSIAGAALAPLVLRSSKHAARAVDAGEQASAAGGAREELPLSPRPAHPEPFDSGPASQALRSGRAESRDAGGEGRGEGGARTPPLGSAPPGPSAPASVTTPPAAPVATPLGPGTAAEAAPAASPTPVADAATAPPSRAPTRPTAAPTAIAHRAAGTRRVGAAAACMPLDADVSVPSRASGDGLLVVTSSTGWGFVDVNGSNAGDTPCTLRVPAGRYRVQVRVPGGRAVAHDVDVPAGGRRTWAAPVGR